MTRPRIMKRAEKQTQVTTTPPEYQILDAADCISRYLPELRRDSDVVVLLVYASRDDTQRLLSNLDPDSTADIAVSGESPKSLVTPTQYNGTWIVGGGFEGRQVGHMMIQFSREGISGVASKMVELVQAIPSVPELKKIIDDYRAPSSPHRE